MTQENVISILDKMDIPVSTIENDLGMPAGTLAKAKKGVRELPQKWDEVLSNYFLEKCPPSPVPSIKEMIVKEEIKRGVVAPRTKLVVDAVGLKEKPSDEREKILRGVMDKINKDFGVGTVMMLGDKPPLYEDVISTGSLSLDIAIGIGGLPRGRMVEIYGQNGSGKTTIATHVLANAQKQGLKCLLVDAENTFDAEYATNIGVDVDDLIYCQPTYAEEALETVDKYILSGKIGVVVVDSVAALVPKSELEGNVGDSKMGLMARIMSQACRKMTGSVSKSNTLLIFLNQIRATIGDMYAPKFVPAGGMALGFYASMRLDVAKAAQIKDGDVSVGNKTRVKVAKNKCAPPFKVAEFDIMFGEGIDRIGELVDIGSSIGIINKSGSWYAYNETKLGQGKLSVGEVLKANPDMAEEIETKIKEFLGNQ